MKTYDEISRNVLERRNEHFYKQRAKRKKIMQISTIIGSFVLVIGFGLGYSHWARKPTIAPGNLGGEAVHTVPLTTKKSTDNLTEDSTTTFPAVNATSPSTTAPAINFPTTPTTTYASNGELYYEIDWDRRSTPGKFRSVVLERDEYSCFGEYVYPFSPTEEQPTKRNATEIVSDKLIEEYEPNGTMHSAVVDLFALEGLSEELAIGVRFPDDDRIFTYVNIFYQPETLGEFLDAIDYDNTVTYGSIMLYPENNFPVNNKNAKDIKSYLLSDKNIANIHDMSVTGNCVIASIYCNELNLINKFFKINEDGYVSTNLIGYEFVFFVGKEATSNFLKDSYNITFEQIKEIYAATTIQTTEPYTADTTTSLPAKHSQAHYATTYGSVTTTEPNDPMWWCGTATE